MKIEDIVMRLEPLRNKERAIGMAAYMRNQFPFLGIQSPERRKALAPLFREARVSKGPINWQLINELWEKDEREYQYVAIDYLKRAKKCLVQEDLSTLKRMIMTKPWWDTVDMLASHLVGYIVKTFPECRSVMDKWIDDEHMWVRRTAILHQLTYKEETDEEKLFAFCHKHAEDKEFFIAKAIGWALREYTKTNPEAVREFVSLTPLQNLSKREALKNLK